MYVKKEAYDLVVKKLEAELASVQYKVGRNKDEFKKLAREQTLLKRERGILCDVIRKVKGEAK
jgi:hypothetical protein